MVSKKVIIHNDTGLHSRPADLFVRTSKLFQSKVTVYKDDKNADAKNIIKVILLNATVGSTIEIQAEGEDEEIALNTLTDLVESNFERVDSRVKI